MLNPEHRASVPGSHHISAVNFWPEVTDGANFPQRVHLIDSTIRKTNFTAGNVTSLAGYVRILEALVELGVETTCLNVPFGSGVDPTPHDWALMKAILDAKLPINVNVWSDVFLGNGRDRGPVDPIDALHRFVDAGATMIAPGIVAAPDRDAEARQAEDMAIFLAEARRLGVTPTVTLAGIGMRDFDQMAAASQHAVDHGVVRLDFMDSTSSMSPEATRAFVTRMRTQVGRDVPITMHMHDEFGLATACALAAASAGAHPDVSLNGMSYRCGFAPLEEVALSLEVFYGVDTGLKLERIDHASRVVARESGLPIPHLKPLTGSFAHLKHSAGEAAGAIRTGQDAFPPLSHGLVPARMGSKVTWIWPAAGSNDLARAIAESRGMTLSDEEAEAVRMRIDAVVADIATFPRWLEPDEAAALLLSTVAVLRGEWRTPTTAVGLGESLPDPVLSEEVLARLENLGVSRHGEIDLEIVRPVLAEAIAALSNGRLIDLASRFGHFDGTSAGPLPDQSMLEEDAIAQSPQDDQAILVSAANEYERHFGFPPLVKAEGRSAGEIAEVVRQGIGRSPVHELERVRRDIAGILDARLIHIATPPEG